MEHYALPAEVYGAGLVFARIGALVMLLPGVGETAVPPRIRMGFAFLLSLALYPVVRAGLPPIPTDVPGLASQVGLEVLIGLAIGVLLRLFLSSLTVAGEIISIQTTLSFAQTANPLQAQPTPTIGTFLTLIGVTLIFSTDLHQLFIAAMAKSYVLFAPGKAAPVKDFAALAIRTTSSTFALGLQLSAPLIVFSLVFNIAAGLVARAMPQFQIFFIATPLTVLLGLSVFALGLGVFGLVWVDRFRDFVVRFA